MKRPPTPSVCPVCSEEVPRNALACPECGADHESGWRVDAEGIDAAGESDFDYDEYAEREFGSPVKPAGVSTFWWVAGIVVLICLGVVFALHQ